MPGSFSDLDLNLARMHANNAVFDEFQRSVEHAFEPIDIKRIRKNWVMTLESIDFPDVLVIVERDERSIHTHIYQRRTRVSKLIHTPANASER